jgi:two-component system NtrC family sensor kinase
MKYLLYLIIVVSFYSKANAQNSKTDSLKLLLEKAPNDTSRVKLLLNIGNQYYFIKPDTSIYYSKMALELSRNLHYSTGIINSLNIVGEAARLLGDYPTSLKMQLEALELNKKIKNTFGEAASLCFTGVTYNDIKEYQKGLDYLLPANSILQNFPVNELGVFILTNIGIAYTSLKNADSALYYLRIAYDKLNYIVHPQLKSYIPTSIGNVYAGLGNKDSALSYYYKALQNSRISNESINMSRVQQKLAELFESNHQYDSSLFYARKAFEDGNRTNQKIFILESSSLLVKLYRKANRLDSAFYYEDIASATKESLYGPEKFKQLQLLMLDEQQRQQELQQAQERYKNKTKMTALWSAIAVFLVIAFILNRNNRHKQKANNFLTEQKNKIELTLEELKTTQKQLIQSEKMASLGELTAGIAHEIQNPLNFVNNFSEVNEELLAEMKDELDKGNIDDAKTIANDAIENQQKILHHGKRADAIVKGMLQHSRSSSGQKEATDINALCDEYLRLAYHGLRAKDKSFNATMKTDFDETIGNINIVPQDIGRVILNLITNAFYAAPLPPEGGFKNPQIKHEPTVWVSTKKVGDKILISVKDNGPGIPQKILDKIFQPFFTTKPTGLGTGLGLSLSYDIVKAHGGELKVETKEGEGLPAGEAGSTFSIMLPL